MTSTKTSVAVTPLRKQELLLEARRTRVEWVDSAASPFCLEGIDEGLGLSSEYGTNDGASLEGLLSLTGVKVSPEVVCMALTKDDNEQEEYYDHRQTQRTIPTIHECSTSRANMQDGTVLLRRARACASLTSAVELVTKVFYRDLPPKEIEERISRQLVTQVNSKEVKDLLASMRDEQQQKGSNGGDFIGTFNFSSLVYSPAIRALTKNLSVTKKAAEGYDVFIRRLRSPECAELVQGMKHFVSSLEQTIQQKVNEVASKEAQRKGKKTNTEGAGATTGRTLFQLQRSGSLNKQKIVQGLAQFVSSPWDSNKRGASSNKEGKQDPCHDELNLSEPSEVILEEPALTTPLKKNNDSPNENELEDPIAELFSLRNDAYVDICQEVASNIQTYVQKHTSTTLKTHVLWQNDSPDEFELQAKIAMETFLFQKFHAALWQLTSDEASDDEMADKLESLQFITWKHLDIKCLTNDAQNPILDERTDNDASKDVSSDEAANAESDKALKHFIPVPSDQWSVPVNALRFLNAQWSPTSKLVLIMKAYRGVSSALCSAMPVGELPGADDTLPTLILALLHAQPRFIVSNLAFIQSFARPDLLRGEPGYVLTSLISALQFLREVNDASALTISPEEFSESFKRCRAKVIGRRQSGEESSNDTSGLENTKLNSEINGGKSSEETKEDNTFQSHWKPLTVHDVRQARRRGEELSLEWAMKGQHVEAQMSCGDDGGGADDIGQTLHTHTKNQSSGSLGSMLSVAGVPNNATGNVVGRNAGFSSSSTAGLTPRSYSYLGVPPEDVRVSDVPVLLEEYHELVRFCESLLNTRNSELAAEQKRQRKAMREQLESNAAAAEVELRGGKSSSGT